MTEEWRPIGVLLDGTVVSVVVPLPEPTPIIERAANAIEHEFDEYADPTGPLSAYGIADRVVRAVLEAIREPTAAMTDAGWSAHDNSMADVWQAMIDAALEEG